MYDSFSFVFKGLTEDAADPDPSASSPAPAPDPEQSAVDDGEAVETVGVAPWRDFCDLRSCTYTETHTNIVDI